MSKLSKFLRSDTGKILAPIATSAATNYAKKQSADFRKVARVVEPILELRDTVKASGSDDVLRDTVYAVAQSKVLGATMNEPQVAPVKPAYQTSTFKIGAIVALLTPLIPIAYKAAENYIGTLPPESWLAMIAPGVLAAVYGLLRYLTTNGERQASATVAAAQAMAAQPAVPENITAAGDVNLGGTTQDTTQVAPRPANAIPEEVEWREKMPGDVPLEPVVEPLTGSFPDDASNSAAAG